MIDPGKMRHRITLQNYNDSVDDYGDVRYDNDENWTDYSTVWAAIDPVSGREFYEAGQNDFEVSHKIRIRALAGVSPRMRIKFGARLFKIVSVINWEERSESMLIMAKELV